MGFTLAEVLVTLVIIGVVAALAIPQFITNANNQANAAKLATVQTDYSNIFTMMMVKENKTDFFETNFGKALIDQNDSQMKSTLNDYVKLARTSSSTAGLGYLSNNSIKSLIPAAYATASLANPCAGMTVQNGQVNACKLACKQAGWTFNNSARLSLGDDLTAYCTRPVSGSCPDDKPYRVFGANSDFYDNCEATNPEAPLGQRWYCCTNKKAPCGSEGWTGNILDNSHLKRCKKDCQDSGWTWTGQPPYPCVGGSCPADKPVRIIGNGLVAPYEGCISGPKTNNKQWWCCPKKNATEYCTTAEYPNFVTEPVPDDFNPADCILLTRTMIPNQKAWCCKSTTTTVCDTEHGGHILSDGSCVYCYENQGGHWIASQEKCVYCSEDREEHWVEATQTCVKCAGDEHWVEAESRCVKCPDGKYWDGTNCVPCEGNKVYIDGACRCPVGTHWNADNSLCESCPEGQEWDESTNSCVEVEITCTGGQELVEGVCVCPESKPIWDGLHGKCIAESEATGTPIHTITNSAVTTDDFNFVLGATTAEAGTNVFFGDVFTYDDGNGSGNGGGNGNGSGQSTNMGNRTAAIVYFDVNGFNVPNKFGRDVFAFVLNDDGKLYPFGSQEAARMLKDKLGLSSVEDATWRSNHEVLGCTGSGFKGLGCTGRLAEKNYKSDY